MKISVNSLSFIALVSFLTACGADLDKRQFRQEKSDRIETEKKLNATEQKLKIITSLAKNIKSTDSLQWTFYVASIGDPINTPFDASNMCSSIGFELPTEQQLLTEGVKIKTIEGLGKMFSPDNTINFKTNVYVSGDSDATLKYLVCVRPLPSN